jgi:very-short-patch-repair endonuclease/DNA polymerase III delta prime subunit
MSTFEDSPVEDLALPGEVEGYAKGRVDRVQKAVKDWRGALVELGGRNNLLHYHDLKRGTLDLTAANQAALEGLLRGRPTKFSSLFGDPEERERQMARIRTIHNKAKENLEERGLATLSLACGLASWDNKRGTWQPCAPVLLQRASLRALGAAQDEFELALVEDMEVNPLLLHLLKTDFDCELDQEALLERVDGVIDEPWELQESYAWLTEQARRVPRFQVESRIVLANFAYAKLPMVRDLEVSFDELVAHELIAALAGDEECRQAIRDQGPGPDAIPRPDDISLSDEFLVLDADSSQNYAINSVIAGQSLIIKGPPGTGKSQTIANLIASLMARGKKVLFVAEKRAAIDAVTKRLNQQKIGELVLDLHGGATSRRAFAQELGRALVASRIAGRVENGVELQRLERRRGELNAYAEALHEKRQPWGLSVYHARAQLMALREVSSEVRFRHQAIEELSGAEADRVEEELAEYAQLGGFGLSTSASPWAKSPIVSIDEVQQAHEVLDEVRREALPNALSLLEQASTESRLPASTTVAGWRPKLDLWMKIGHLLAACRPEVFELDLNEICEDLAPAGRGGFTRVRAALGSAPYKAARQQLRSIWVSDGKPGDDALYQQAVAARDIVMEWSRLDGAGIPSAPADIAEREATYKYLLQRLAGLGAWIGGDGLTTMSTVDLKDLLLHLDGDRTTLANLPEIHRLERSLVAAGLEELLPELQHQQASEDFARKAFRYTWLHSVLDHVSLASALVAGFVAEKHERVADEFKAGDHLHLEATSARILRVCAEAAVKVRDEFKDQAALVQRQAELKRRHLPVRELVHNAADVLLALKPCWAMSPLMVSQLLPARSYFDVVIFDEASQITPADAVSSILRGKQLVVAGDDKQLPPTAFFASDSPEDDTEGDDALSSLFAGTEGFESILNALGSLLRFRVLQWHYRSRDERLIAFSNAHIYDHMLTTFAGVGGHSVLSYVPVTWQPGDEPNSPTSEVNTAVDEVLDHARRRPDESLGVIAMGIKHAQRIEACLRQRLSEDPLLAEELEEFFDESRDERFFVKNLENVQGDERDAIILSIGYGKNARGDLPYRFGPLLTDGGERRLNVAVTRAKSRVTLIASFSHRDMDPERSNAEGVRLMRQYLQYIESDGSNLGDHVLEKPALNPFEVDVRDTLERRGLKLTPQYGSSGYWIDFAVQHPMQWGRYVLALECDGATYHSSESARDRDRLRQEQLERLGWRFHRIWSSEWFYNKDVAVDKAIMAYEQAVSQIDGIAPSPNGLADDGDVPQTLTFASQQSGEISADEAGSDNDSQAPRVRPMGSRPFVLAGKPIHAYADSELVALVRWIESDDLLRTEDELVDEMMRELGFRRHGKNVVATLAAAITRARR